MKKIAFFTLIFSLLFVLSCKNKSKRNEIVDDNKNDTTIIVNNIVDEDSVVLEIDTTLKDVKFNNPDENTIYFCTNEFIAKINQKKLTIDTVLKHDNIDDFIFKDNSIIVSIFLQKDSVFYIYKSYLNDINLKKLFKIKISEVMTLIKKSNKYEENIEFYGLKIMALSGNEFHFVVQYYFDYSEGPYIPEEWLTIDLNDESMSVDRPDAQPENGFADLMNPQNVVIEENSLVYIDGENRRVLAKSSVFDYYLGGEDQVVLSPDGSKVLWYAQTEWLEGPIYSYYLVDVSGKNGVVLNIGDYYTWLDKNKLLAISWNGLVLYDKYNKSILISEKAKKFRYFIEDDNHIVLPIYY